MKNHSYRKALYRGMALATTSILGTALVVGLAWYVPVDATGRVMPTTAESTIFTAMGMAVLGVTVFVIDAVARE